MVRAYSRTGWFRESYRHSLAAQGVKTSYFAKKGRGARRGEGVGFVRNDEDERNDEKESFKDRAERMKQQGEEAKRKGAYVFTETARLGKRPVDVLTEGVYKEKLEDYQKRVARLERPTDKALRSLNEGDASIAIGRYQKLDNYVNEMSRVKDLTDKDREKITVAKREMESIRVALSTEAARRARVGMSVSGEIRDIVGRDVEKELSLIEEQRARERESPFRTEVREFARETAADVLSGAVVTKPLGQALETGAAGLREGALPIPGAPGTAQDFPGLFDDRVTGEQGLAGLPFFKTNVFIGNEEDGFLNSGTPPRIAGGIDKTLRDVSAQRAAAGGRAMETNFEKVKKSIDAMHSNLGEISSVDYGSFEKGNVAFERGDRESLIEAITDLKSEEGKLHDRWTIVGQMHAQLIDPLTVSSAYADRGSDNIVFSKGGAGEVAETTRKLNKIKRDIKIANDQVASRRKMLEFSLQRMDAVVPNVERAPKEVKVFKEGILSGYSNPVTGAENPALRRTDDGSTQ